MENKMFLKRKLVLKLLFFIVSIILASEIILVFGISDENSVDYYSKNIVNPYVEGLKNRNNFNNYSYDKYASVIKEEEMGSWKFPTKNQGYIIEFEDEPIAVKYSKLKETAEANEDKIKAMNNFNPLKYVYSVTLLRKNDVPQKLSDIKYNLKKSNEIIKRRIKNKLEKNNFVSGNAITIAGSKSDLELTGEWDYAFNGIALNISYAEAEKIKSVPGVKYISPDYEVQINMMDSVPLTQADYVWQLDYDGNSCSSSGKDCLTGKGIKIAIIDTGIDYTHPDLGGCFGRECKVIGGYDLFNNDSDPMDDHSHGTHVAGIAAGTGEGGLKGISPDAKLLAYKVLSDKGGGWVKDIIKGINQAVYEGADIISMSLGGSWCDPYDGLSSVSNNAMKAGVIVVISAGNSGPKERTVKSPGCASEVITVGASYKKDYFKFNFSCPISGNTYCGKKCEYIGQQIECDYWGDGNPNADQVTSFSSRGPVYISSEIMTKPDVVAPGAIICSARYDNKYPEETHPYYYPCIDKRHVQLAGTSMSAPLVSGAAALIKQAKNNWTSEEIKYLIKYTAKDLGYDENTQGGGRIDIPKAISKKIMPPITKIKIKNITETTIDIHGTIKGKNISYKLFHKIEGTSDWVKVLEGDGEIIDGIIYDDFNISGFTYGIPVTFKLYSENTYGDNSIATVEFIRRYEELLTKLKEDADGYTEIFKIFENKILLVLQMAGKIDLFDINSRQRTHLKTVSTQYWTFSPNLYDNNIIYAETDMSGNDKLILYNIALNSTKMLVSRSHISNSPLIYEDLVAYYAGTMKIYSLSDNGIENINNSSGFNGHMDMDKNYLIYDGFDYNSFLNTINLYNFNTKELKDISQPHSSFAIMLQSSRVSGDFAAWTSVNTGDVYTSHLTDIYIYNLKTNKTYIIPQIWKNREIDSYGNKLVYTKYEVSSGFLTSNIFLYDMANKKEYRVTDYDFLSGAFYPRIYNDLIIWEKATYNGKDGLYFTNITKANIIRDKRKECNDTIDNDNDGRIDMQDSGCENSTDDDETDCGDGVCEGGETWQSCTLDCLAPQCSDKIDNDNDRYIDYPADLGCSSPEDNDERISCSDSDGGINYYIKGTLVAGNNTEDDYCDSYGFLREFYCDDNSDDSIGIKRYNCSVENKQCINGACIVASCINECPASGQKRCNGQYSQTCGNYDSDSCFEWNSGDFCTNGCNQTSGNCNGQSCTPATCSSLGRQCGSWSDGCNGTLNCGTCPAGQTCNMNGQCILSSGCTDSDGGINYYEKGIATNNSGSYPDYCYYEGISIMHEYFCLSNSIIKETVSCPLSCSNGKCNGDYYCVDSDGKNPNIKGVTVDKTGNYTDYCKSSSSVKEYYCISHTGELRNKDISCSGGKSCIDGACTTGSCTPATCSSLGRQCGSWSDGCNGTLNCGTCPAGQTCNMNGQCVASCINECPASGQKRCNGQYSQTCGNYDSDSCFEWNSGDFCTNGCNQTSGNCNGQSCTPQCSGKQCGNDGCSGSCGTCSSGLTCNSNGFCVNGINQFCFDSDNKNISVKSTLYHYTGNYTDYCYNNYIVEYYCSGISYASNWYTCPSGQSCIDGACITSLSSEKPNFFRNLIEIFRKAFG